MNGYLESGSSIRRLLRFVGLVAQRLSLGSQFCWLFGLVIESSDGIIKAWYTCCKFIWKGMRSRSRWRITLASISKTRLHLGGTREYDFCKANGSRV